MCGIPPIELIGSKVGATTLLTYFGFFFMAKSSAVIACEKYTASCAA